MKQEGSIRGLGKEFNKGKRANGGRMERVVDEKEERSKGRGSQRRKRWMKGGGEKKRDERIRTIARVNLRWREVCFL